MQLPDELYVGHYAPPQAPKLVTVRVGKLRSARAGAVAPTAVVWFTCPEPHPRQPGQRENDVAVSRHNPGLPSFSPHRPPLTHLEVVDPGGGLGPLRPHRVVLPVLLRLPWRPTARFVRRCCVVAWYAASDAGVPTCSWRLQMGTLPVLVRKAFICNHPHPTTTHIRTRAVST